MKLAVCGYGGMGSAHMKSIIPDTSERIIAYGAFDIDEKRQEAAREDGFKVYDSYEDLLMDEDVDIVLVATPNDSHKDLSIAAMRAGKHVVCEKPVTMNSEELLEIMEVSKETKKVFMVHQNRRWDDDYLVIKNLFDNKPLGDVFHLESRVHGANGIPGDWRCEARHGGGMLLDWGVHLLDQILDMVPGKVKSVYADGSYILGHDSDDGFMCYLQFENGVTAHVEVGTTNFIRMPRWYVKALNGSALLENWDLEGHMLEYNYDADQSPLTPIKAGAGFTKTMAPLNQGSLTEHPLPEPLKQPQSFYDNFADVVLEGAEAKIKNEEVLRVMRLIEAAFESMRENKVVYFE